MRALCAPHYFGCLLSSPEGTQSCSSVGAPRQGQPAYLLDRWSPLLAKDGTSSVKRPDNLAWGILLPRNPTGLSCCKSATRDKLLYFPSEGRHAGDFYLPRLKVARLIEARITEVLLYLKNFLFINVKNWYELTFVSYIAVRVARQNTQIRLISMPGSTSCHTETAHSEEETKTGDGVRRRHD
jgi:hypothetical protein